MNQDTDATKIIGTSGSETDVAALLGSPEHPFPDLHSASSAYAQRFQGTIGAYFLEVQSRAVVNCCEHLTRNSGPLRTVLDVGGGHGQSAILLAGMGVEVTVLGSSRDAFEELDRRLTLPENEPLRKRIRKVVGPLLPLPASDQIFDLCISLRILPHTLAWRDLLGEMTRVARRGVIFDYPSSRSINSVGGTLFSLKRATERTTRPYLVFEDVEVAEAASQLGWNVSYSERQFLLPMALHRMHKSRLIASALEDIPRAVGLTSRFGSPVVALLTHQRQASNAGETSPTT